MSWSFKASRPLFTCANAIHGRVGLTIAATAIAGIGVTPKRMPLLAEAKSQLERYAADNNLSEIWQLTPKGNVTLIRLAVVFHGEELLFAEEI